jgi:hypothetical protein
LASEPFLREQNFVPPLLKALHDKRSASQNHLKMRELFKLLERVSIEGVTGDSVCELEVLCRINDIINVKVRRYWLKCQTYSVGGHLDFLGSN